MITGKGYREGRAIWFCAKTSNGTVTTYYMHTIMLNMYYVYARCKAGNYSFLGLCTFE